MLVLAFDTSSPAVTVALIDSDVEVSAGEPVHTSSVRFVSMQTLAERTEVASNRQGELLAPLIDEVLAAGGVSPTDLAAIAVGLGPGPFTGLRVGIVTAKAMSDALGIPAYGQCSLDVIASRVASGGDRFAVVADARRKQVYWRLYDENGDAAGEPELAPAVEVAEAITGRVSHVVGAGAQLYREAFASVTVAEDDLYPAAAELGQMVALRAGLTSAGDELTPLYLRRPDAQPPGAPKKVTPG